MTEQLLASKVVIEEYLKSSEKKNEKVLKTLNELLQVPVTKETLTSTKIGIAVNKIRKEAPDQEVQKAAVEVLSKWKEVMVPSAPSVAVKRAVEPEEVKEEKKSKASEADDSKVATTATSDNTGDSTSDTTGDNSTTSTSTDNTTNATNDTTSSTSSNTTTPSQSKDYLKDYLIGDAVRDKCLEMFVIALSADSPTNTPDDLILSTAQSIERSLFAEFGGVTATYKTKFRSKYLNLKEASNRALREAMISGMINADRFIAMTTAEMASEERKSIDAKIAHQNLLNSQMAKDNSAETDQFKCGRCQQRRCKYYQMQTRSADEPMTTFVTCVNCGNRWRFC